MSLVFKLFPSCVRSFISENSPISSRKIAKSLCNATSAGNVKRAISIIASTFVVSGQYCSRSCWFSKRMFILWSNMVQRLVNSLHINTERARLYAYTSRHLICRPVLESVRQLTLLETGVRYAALDESLLR